MIESHRETNRNSFNDFSSSLSSTHYNHSNKIILNSSYGNQLGNNNINLSINRNPITSIFQSNNFIPPPTLTTNINTTTNNSNNNNNIVNLINSSNTKHKPFFVDEIDEDFLP